MADKTRFKIRFMEQANGQSKNTIFNCKSLFLYYTPATYKNNNFGLVCQI